MKPGFYERKKVKSQSIKHFINAGIAMVVFATLQSSTANAANMPGGNLIAKKIVELKQQGVFKSEVNIFSVTGRDRDESITKVVSDYTLLSIQKNKVSEILRTKPEYLKLVVPVENGFSNFTLLLYKVNISPGEFNLLTSEGPKNPLDYNVIHYRGSIENDDHSVVSFTFSDNETMGLISNDHGNYVLGKIKDNVAGKYIIYNDTKLIPHSNFDCSATVSTNAANRTGNPGTANSLATANCVNWYWETDYDIFTDKGSIANVNSYIQGVFNQVSTLYANDGISINLQTVYIWSTVDPYTGPSTGDYLTQFGNNRTSFTGNLAHLIGYNGGGGIAWVDGLCSVPQFEMGYSGINSTYSNVPVFSWTVECIAHEEGHLLGSNHTHDCVWNGNNTAIDGCGNAAGYPGGGSCTSGPYPPTTGGKGTIMSYCHLNVGIDFNLGLGPQPTALIINKINTGSCLSACSGCSAPAQPAAISGSASPCPGSSQTYSVTAVTGATSYTWTLPSGWSGSSTTNSITLTTGSSGTLSVTANNSCGNSTAQTLAVTAGTSVPSQPGPISGSTSACPASSQTYSVSSVSGAASYSWTLPSGWSGSSTTNSITVTAGNSGGTISVTAINGCGNSTSQTLAVATGSTVPAQPGTISGSASICPGSSQTYSVTSVSGASSYTWSLPSGWSGSSTTNSITVTTGGSGGSISITANNACGSSTASTLNVGTGGTVPSQPGSISGSASICPGSSQTYSISSVTGALSYTWILPSGWSGPTTGTSITVTGGGSGGTISVTANNSCGNSTPSTLSVNTGSTPPAQPGSISGSTIVCQSSLQTYSVTPVAGATSYTWTRPSGWSGSSTTNSINVTAGASGGNITVRANNSCGNSSVQSVSVGVSNVTNQPGSITGNASACQNSVQTYSVSPVSGAAFYTWTLPSGWSGVSSTNSISVTTGTSNGTISIQANNSCGISNTRTKSVTITNVPNQPNAIIGNAIICAGTLQAYSVNSVAGATGYSWILPSGWSGNATGNSIAVDVGNSGGTISVMANNGCGSSSQNSLSVTVNPSAAVSLSQTGNYIVVSPVSLADNIQWYYENALVPGSNDSLLYQGLGNYYCIVTNSYGCTKTTSVLNVTGATGIIENESAVYAIFPNPATDFIQIRNIRDTNMAVIQIALYNVEGKKILEKRIDESSSVVDVKNIASGFYFYQLNDGGAILQSGKLIILKKDE